MDAFIMACTFDLINIISIQPYHELSFVHFEGIFYLCLVEDYYFLLLYRMLCVKEIAKDFILNNNHKTYI